MMLTSRKSNLTGVVMLAALAAFAVVLWQQPAPAAAQAGIVVPAANTSLNNSGDGPQTAVLAGGCFWGMEMVFNHVKGVTDVVSGYAGGKKSTANYEDSSSGKTNQAESVRVTYNPQKVSYAELLRIYFSVAHDPTQVDRQGPDRGPQYRSEIFALNAGQARMARAYIKQLDNAGVFPRPIATQVSHLAIDHFYKAEAYHQNYGARNPNSLYIRINDVPKVAALKKHFARLYRTDRPARLAQAD